jgi:outer membrane protein OmpA-like peptidoglycan-associated protein
MISFKKINYLLKGGGMKKLLMLLVSIALFATGCATVKENKKTTIGAVAGAVVGAGVGYAIGGGQGAAIGAGVGALAGGGIGYMMDRQEKEFRKELAESEAASIRREQETLILSFKSDMWFDFDSSILKPGAYSEIDRVANILNRYPKSSIRIEGHTDSVGDETYNLDLSERRAIAVKDTLVAKGVNALRVQAVGFGESMPVASNDEEGGRQLNRRVSIVIVPAKNS